MRKIRVQPIHSVTDSPDELDKSEPLKHTLIGRSRFVKLIPSVLLRTSSTEKVCVNDESQLFKDGSNEFEPSSVCLAKMVQNFMEDCNGNSDDSDRKHSNSIPVKCGRRHCNCFNGCVDGDGNVDSSDDEPDCFGGCFGDSNHSSSLDVCDILKSLVLCSSVVERNLLADIAKIVEKNKICKQRGEGCRNFVVDGLVALGYDASICKSQWERTSAFPAGEYEYIDAVHESERLLIDIDFRSEFEIARPTKTYKTILQTLPVIFVGNSDRLEKIISTVTDAAKQSLKKKGLHFPPWRKSEYVKLKWLSPFTRIAPSQEPPALSSPTTNSPILDTNMVFLFHDDGEDHEVKAATPNVPDQVVAMEWTPKSAPSGMKQKTGVKVVTGLSSIMKD